MKQYTFPRELRLLTPKNFSAVFNNPVRASTQEVTLLAVKNNLGHPRLGITLSKKNVKLAVQRNRIKRLIRDSFRLQQHNLPSIDIVILGKKGIHEMDNAAITKLIEKQWRRLTKRCNSQ